ncbi:hypothetical protein BO1005MUT1_520017 [Hyphomicrobiales bacterium]|nr:hypothetical protein BO1005MUT1_520017 [Hyphomicrobiales bacterium]
MQPYARRGVVSTSPPRKARRTIGREFQRLTSAIRELEKTHKGENASRPEPDESLLRPDNLPFSGLPGNLGKPRKD